MTTAPDDCFARSDVARAHDRVGDEGMVRVGRAAHTLLPLLEKALQCFAEAERIHPPGNDDAILRWNRCVRLLQNQPDFEMEESVSFEAHDGPPA